MAILETYIVQGLNGIYAFKDKPNKYQGAMSTATDIEIKSSTMTKVPLVAVGELIACGLCDRINVRYKTNSSGTEKWKSVDFLCLFENTNNILNSMRGLPTHSFFGDGSHATAKIRGRRLRRSI